MHAIFVLIDSTAKPADIQGPLQEFANALKVRDGLIMKSWITRDGEIGGFYLFTDQTSAERYVAEMLAPAVEAQEPFSNLRVEHFEVLEELSAVTGSPVATPLAG